MELELGGAHAAAIALAVMSGTLLLVFFALWTRHARDVRVRAATPVSADLSALVRLQNELSELVRDAGESLDLKMRALRELLQEAHAAIGHLRRLTAVATPHAGRAALDPQFSASADAAGPEQCSLSNQTVLEQSVVESATGLHSKGLAPADPVADRYAHVYSLAETGLDTTQISTQTGMHRGEVELILSLRRKKSRVDRGSRPEPTRARYPSEEAHV